MGCEKKCGKTELKRPTARRGRTVKETVPMSGTNLWCRKKQERQGQEKRASYLLPILIWYFRNQITVMTPDEILIKIQAMRKELHRYNTAYYQLDNPEISDYEFDMKLKELEVLESQYPQFFDPNSPTQRVGGGITKNFQTHIHENRMYSLDNSYSKEDLLDWEIQWSRVLTKKK